MQKQIQKKSLLSQAGDKQNSKSQTIPSSLEMEEEVSINRIISLHDRNLKQLLRNSETREVQSFFDKLIKQIQSTNYGKAKKTRLFHLSTCFYNKAATFQKSENKQKSTQNLQQALHLHQSIQGSTRQENVGLNIERIKMILQYCGSLSQTGRHDQAVGEAGRALEKVIETFRMLYSFCDEILGKPSQETASNSWQVKHQTEIINFKQVVVRDANRYLKELSDLPTPNRLLFQYKNKFQQVSQKMFYWKNNKDNNQKNIRKFLQITESIPKRSILGVQKKAEFLNTHHIGALMTLECKSIKKDLEYDQYSLLSIPKIIELIFYASIGYFTLATQTRFSGIDLNIHQLKIEDKYKKLTNDERIRKCKIFHLKAIELAGRYFQPNNNEYFTHLLDSFNKNYKCLLEQIDQQNETTILSKKHEKQESKQNSQFQYGFPSVVSVKLTSKKRKISQGGQSTKNNRSSKIESSARKKDVFKGERSAIELRKFRSFSKSKNKY